MTKMKDAMSIIDSFNPQEKQMAMTVEERREARRLAQIRYRTTVKGKASVKKYNASASHKKARKKYNKSEKGIAYNTSACVKNKKRLHYYNNQAFWFIYRYWKNRGCKTPTMQEIRDKTFVPGPLEITVEKVKPPTHPHVQHDNKIRKNLGLPLIMSLDEYRQRMKNGTLYKK